MGLFDFQRKWFVEGNWTANAQLPPNIVYHMQNQPREFVIFQIIAGVASAICLCLAGVQVVKFRRVGHRVRVLRGSVFLPVRTELLLSMAVFPACICFCQLLGLIFVRQARLVLLLSDLYTSIVLSRFWSFIVGLFGGAEKVARLAGTKKPYRIYTAMPLCFIGALLPKRQFAARDLRHSRLAVWQFTVLVPIASLVRAFNNGIVNVEQLLNYCTALSMFICMWGLHVLTRALWPRLHNTVGIRLVVETTVMGTRLLIVFVGIPGVVKGRGDVYDESVMVMAVTNFCITVLALAMAVVSFFVFSAHKLHAEEIQVLEMLNKSVPTKTASSSTSSSSSPLDTLVRLKQQNQYLNAKGHILGGSLSLAQADREKQNDAAATGAASALVMPNGFCSVCLHDSRGQHVRSLLSALEQNIKAGHSIAAATPVANLFGTNNGNIFFDCELCERQEECGGMREESLGSGMRVLEVADSAATEADAFPRDNKPCEIHELATTPLASATRAWMTENNDLQRSATDNAGCNQSGLAPVPKAVNEAEVKHAYDAAQRRKFTVVLQRLFGRKVLRSEVNPVVDACSDRNREDDAAGGPTTEGRHSSSTGKATGLSSSPEVSGAAAWLSVPQSGMISTTPDVKLSRLAIPRYDDGRRSPTDALIFVPKLNTAADHSKQNSVAIDVRQPNDGVDATTTWQTDISNRNTVRDVSTEAAVYSPLSATIDTMFECEEDPQVSAKMNSFANSSVAGKAKSSERALSHGNSTSSQIAAARSFRTDDIERNRPSVRGARRPSRQARQIASTHSTNGARERNLLHPTDTNIHEKSSANDADCYRRPHTVGSGSVYSRRSGGAPPNKERLSQNSRRPRPFPVGDHSNTAPASYLELPRHARPVFVEEPSLNAARLSPIMLVAKETLPSLTEYDSCPTVGAFPPRTRSASAGMRCMHLPFSPSASSIRSLRGRAGGVDDWFVATAATTTTTTTSPSSHSSRPTGGRLSFPQSFPSETFIPPRSSSSSSNHNAAAESRPPFVTRAATRRTSPSLNVSLGEDSDRRSMPSLRVYEPFVEEQQLHRLGARRSQQVCVDLSPAADLTQFLSPPSTGLRERLARSPLCESSLGRRSSCSSTSGYRCFTHPEEPISP